MAQEDHPYTFPFYLKISFRDGASYFLAQGDTKSGGYKGLQVDVDADRKVPSKAANKTIPEGRHPSGWKVIPEKEVPDAVRKRFQDKSEATEMRTLGDVVEELRQAVGPLDEMGGLVRRKDGSMWWKTPAGSWRKANPKNPKKKRPGRTSLKDLGLEK